MVVFLVTFIRHARHIPLYSQFYSSNKVRVSGCLTHTARTVCVHAGNAVRADTDPYLHEQLAIRFAQREDGVFTQHQNFVHTLLHLVCEPARHEHMRSDMHQFTK